MPNKYTVIRGLIMKQTEPFCLLDLFLRLAKEGIDNREDIMPDQYELLINFTSIYRAKAGKLRNLVKYCIE
jgi:hypothetical protein